MHIIQKSNSFCFLNIKKREKKNHTNSESSWLGDARSRDELPRPVPNPRAAGFFLSLLKMTLKKICKSHFLFKKMQPVVFFLQESAARGMEPQPGFISSSAAPACSQPHWELPTCWNTAQNPAQKGGGFSLLCSNPSLRKHHSFQNKEKKFTTGLRVPETKN